MHVIPLSKANACICCFARAHALIAELTVTTVGATRKAGIIPRISKHCCHSCCRSHALSRELAVVEFGVIRAATVQSSNHKHHCHAEALEQAALAEFMSVRLILLVFH